MEQKLKFDLSTTQQIIQKIGQIDQFKGEWKALDQSKNRYLRELRRIATIQSIGSSTRIEGSTLTDAEVETLLKNLKISKLESRDEQEVAGYFDTLETILDNFADIELSLSSIHNLHNFLLKHSTKDHHHRGRFKELPNRVVANYPDGTVRTVFNTTEPFLTEKEMAELLDWANEQFKKNEMHPLIVTAAFVYEFLSIHPYQDGNGRLSRLLTNFLLLKAGYKFVVYVSLEHIVEARKKAYYQALMEGQKNRYSDQERIDQWMLFFLECLVELAEKLKAKMAQYQVAGAYISERQQRIIDFIKEKGNIKISDLTKALPEENRETLRKDLQYLVRELVIEKVGEKRGATYVIKAPTKV